MRFKLNQLFANYTVLMTDSEKLWVLVTIFGLVCEMEKVKVNIKKSRVMWSNLFGRKGISVSWKICGFP